MISAEKKKALTDGADIIIATPGRFLSHLTLGYVDLSELQCLILDEADRMLDMGFVGDIMRIAEKCRDDRQTCCSALPCQTASRISRATFKRTRKS